MATIDAGRCPVCGGPLAGLRQIAGCVYSEPCGHRLYRGRLPNAGLLDQRIDAARAVERPVSPAAPLVAIRGPLHLDGYWHTRPDCAAHRAAILGNRQVVMLPPVASRTLPASKRCPLCWPDGGPTPAQP